MPALPRALFRLGRNLVKYRLLGDVSIRSDRFERAHMADLMFNDFYRFKGHPALGERKAFAEFLAIDPRLLVTDYAKFASVGQAFIVHTPDTDHTARRPVVLQRPGDPA